MDSMSICDISNFELRKNTSNNIIDYAGHYKQTQWRAVLEMSINLVVSIVCVYKFGIYGVLFGTIVALLYRTNDIILYANCIIMKRSAWPTYRRWLRNILLLIICAYVGSCLPESYSNYGVLIVYAAVVSVCVLLFFMVINTIFEKNARENCIDVYEKKF